MSVNFKYYYCFAHITIIIIISTSTHIIINIVMGKVSRGRGDNICIYIPCIIGSRGSMDK